MNRRCPVLPQTVLPQKTGKIRFYSWIFENIQKNSVLFWMFLTVLSYCRVGCCIFGNKLRQLYSFGNIPFGKRSFGNLFIRQHCPFSNIPFGNDTIRQHFHSATFSFGNTTHSATFHSATLPFGNTANRQRYHSATLPIGKNTIRQHAFKGH